MKTNPATESSPFIPLPLTKHAQTRMNARRLPTATVNAVMIYGRVVRVRGAEIYVIGRKEVERYLAEGVDLVKFQGVQVLCGADGAILTVYRNNDFRGLRPRGGRRHYRLAA